MIKVPLIMILQVFALLRKSLFQTYYEFVFLVQTHHDIALFCMLFALSGEKKPISNTFYTYFISEYHYNMILKGLRKSLFQTYHEGFLNFRHTVI